MKKYVITIAFILIAATLGCWFLRTRAHSKNTQPATLSINGYTWKVGGFTLDGTNVPAGQLRITAIRGTNVPPQTNEQLR